MPTNPTIVFTAARRVVIEDRPQPVLKTGQLLIETLVTQISTGTELTILEADYPRSSTRWATYGQFPFVAGYSNIGRVIDAGAGATKDWIGKTVATPSPHARYVVFPADQANVVPDPIAPEQAVFFTIAQIVANGLRRGQLAWGESVIVYGLGLLGQLTVRLCRLAGARPVFAVDTAEPRLKLLPGGDPSVVPINPHREALKSVVETRTRGRLADVVFELTGVGSLIPRQFELLRRQGRFVLLSSPRGESVMDMHELVNAPSIAIIGAHNSSHPPVESLNHPWTQHRHNELFFDLLADGQLDVIPLITHRRPYTDAVPMYDLLMADRSQAMGVLLDWT